MSKFTAFLAKPKQLFNSMMNNLESQENDAQAMLDLYEPLTTVDIHTLANRQIPVFFNKENIGSLTSQLSVEARQENVKFIYFVDQMAVYDLVKESGLAISENTMQIFDGFAYHIFENSANNAYSQHLAAETYVKPIEVVEHVEINLAFELADHTENEVVNLPLTCHLDKKFTNTVVTYSVNKAAVLKVIKQNLMKFPHLTYINESDFHFVVDETFEKNLTVQLGMLKRTHIETIINGFPKEFIDIPIHHVLEDGQLALKFMVPSDEQLQALTPLNHKILVKELDPYTDKTLNIESTYNYDLFNQTEVKVLKEFMGTMPNITETDIQNFLNNKTKPVEMACDPKAALVIADKEDNVIQMAN